MISIIIPLYNKKDCIKETIQSVLSQSFIDFEIVIVNDGSTDHSLEVVQTFSDERIRIIDKPNGGVSSARNKGIEEAKGEWLLFLDADDKLLKNGLSTLYNIHLKYPTADVCAGNFNIFFSKNAIKKGCTYQHEGIIDNPFKLRWHKTWNLRLGAFIINKRCLAKVPGFHSVMTRGEDTYFTDSLITNFKIAYLPICVMEYNRENSSLSNMHHYYTKNISSYLELSTGNQYQQLTNAEMVGKGIILSLINKRWSTTCFLIKKNYKYIFLIIKALCFGLFHKYNHAHSRL